MTDRHQSGKRQQAGGPQHFGDPKNLTWAVFEFTDAIHGIPGKYVAGAPLAWPADHVRSATCPCRPEEIPDRSGAGLLPLYEHRPAGWLSDHPAERAS